ncbi:hypothetical protein ARC20_13780 [Stenotrophomonas panacihumi]|uniref:Uncharacterized protein n=1 Tax=Stenotrophomonas panacihumi TaxID=676599 RepID=A0A0R0AEI5_9GAMM|nr:hypothetical protein [Stenotrophomonas panacihumi]KRG39352.1 hypothetical protein ARC20_13780 [Stenotrophomonas panacihumi]PTN54768.1 hypothetical protein C9J98_08720 [Stenotrophomonas panacihumi]
MTGKVMVGAVLAVVALYGVLWVINARDQAPSAQVQAFHAELARRPALADADNAFVYLSGMGAANAGERELRKARSPAVRKLASACSQDAKACAEALPRADATLSQWLADEAGLLERYQSLIQHAGWREPDTANIALVLPPYQYALDGQQLLLLQAWQRARAGDAAAARALLEGDLSFWRRVLRDSDLLVSKAIAAAAIRRHFALGNLVLREQAIAPPAGWAVPFTVEERSLRRALAGELRLAENTSDSVLASLPPPETSLERVGNALQAPFFKRQATINLLAENYDALAAASEAPLAQLPQQLAQLRERDTGPGWRWVYNPTGHALVRVGNFPQNYGDYVYKSADLEGLRRAALTTVRRESQAERQASICDHLLTNIRARDVLRCVSHALRARAQRCRPSLCGVPAKAI